MAKKKKIRNEKLKCPFCESDSIVKNGIIKAKQRFLCKNCEKNFYPDITLLKIDKCRQAIIMYLEGLQYKEIGRILNTDRYTVREWIKKYGDNLEEIRNKRITESMRVEEIYAIVDNKNKDRTEPYKPISFNTGFTIVEKEDKTHISFLKGNQHYQIIFKERKTDE